jgi:hypothetical protein
VSMAPGACSKNPVTYYLNLDHDGYGDPLHSISACSQPIGYYVLQGGDCCDSDATVHPGQTSAFSTTNACGTFDYNCDGSVQKVSYGPLPGQCGAPNCQLTADGTNCYDNGGCTCSGKCTTYSVSACGDRITQQDPGCTNTGHGCSTFDFGYTMQLQECF